MKKYGMLRWLVVLFVLLTLVFIPGAIGFASTESNPPEGDAQNMGEEVSSRGGRILSSVTEYMEQVTGQLSEAAQGLLLIPDLFTELVAKAQDPTHLKAWREMAIKIFLILLAGLLVELIVRRMLKKKCNSVEQQQVERISFKVLLVTARTLLDILPILAFAVAAYGVLPFTAPQYQTRLIALTLINAIVMARIILAVFRMFLIPGVPSLRLLAADEESVYYFYLWARRLVGLGVFGYFILEAALLMGIPNGLYVFLMNFLALTLSSMLVILVMQNKKEVAGWISGEKTEEDKANQIKDKSKPMPVMQTFRRVVANYWHMAAILLIMGVFATWVLEIEGAMFFLVYKSFMTGVVGVVTGLLVRMVHRGIDRIFKISDELKMIYPDLEERANRYQPIVRKVLKGVVYAIGFFAVLEVWGLGTLGWLFSPSGGIVIGESIILVLIIAAAFLLWELTSVLIERSLMRESEAAGGNTRKLTLLPLLKNLIRITIAMIAIMLVLSQIGLNIAPLIAGAGVIGLAIGFGAQTLVKDVITGAFILLENGISIGDWVEAGGYSGTVEHLTVRTVTLRDLAGTLHLVPFGEVTVVSNYNREYAYALIDAGVAYRERYDDVVQALQDVSLELKKDHVWSPSIIGDLEVFGMNNLDDSAVEIRVRLKTLPLRQFAVRRAFLEHMKRVFDERNIEIPFPHRTVWFGVDKDGTAPPMYLSSDEEDKKRSFPKAEPAEEPRARTTSESEASQDVMEEKESVDSDTGPNPEKI